MDPNECVLCVCVCIFGFSFTYVIKSIDSKLISVCLIHDYSLIADLYIFVYGRAECEFISLECTKVKLLILNNFGLGPNKRDYIIGKHLRVELLNTPNVFHIPLLFYATQVFNSFLNSRIAANHDKVERFSANGEIPVKWFVLYCRIVFD